ncbi:hypothetical protein [Aliivibrio logei]|uniref:hypothetical protein n=1 Tax=Aliivibrio logei TaxID=688 RepID=UPI00076A69D0
MNRCPHCNKTISHKTEDEWYSYLPPRGGDGSHEFTTTCCKNKVKLYCEGFMFYLISEPARENEKPVIFGVL